MTKVRYRAARAAKYSADAGVLYALSFGHGIVLGRIQTPNMTLMWHNLTFCNGVVLGHPAGQHRVLAQPVNLGQGAYPLGVIAMTLVTRMKTMTVMIISLPCYNKQNIDYWRKPKKNPIYFCFSELKRCSQKRKSVFTKTLIRK